MEKSKKSPTNNNKNKTKNPKGYLHTNTEFWFYHTSLKFFSIFILKVSATTNDDDVEEHEGEREIDLVYCLCYLHFGVLFLISGLRL